MDQYQECLRRVWIPSEAKFNPDCLPLLTTLPTVVPLILLLLTPLLRPLSRHVPSILRPFARESFSDELQVLGRDWISRQPRTEGERTIIVFGIIAMALAHESYQITKRIEFAVAGGPAAVATVGMLVRGMQGRYPRGLFVVYAVLLLAQLAFLLGVPEIQNERRLLIGWIWTMVPTVGIFAIIINTPLRPAWSAADGVARPSMMDEPSADLRSPEDNFTPWQWISIRWLTPIIKVAGARQLNAQDVWKLPFEYQHARLHSCFQDLSGTVAWRLIIANGLDMFITTSLATLETCASFATVILMKQLLVTLGTAVTQGPITYFDNKAPKEPQDGIRVALVYAALMLGSNVVASQTRTFALWFSRRAYERSRGELITMIYEKTLTRKAFTFPGKGKNTATPTGKSPASTGKILNLMRNDVYEIAQRLWEFHKVFRLPLELIFSTVLIWRILGPAALSGTIVLIVAQLVTVGLFKLRYRWELLRRSISDRKLSLVSQFIDALRHLRYYAWQDYWCRDITSVREEELWLRVWTGSLNAIVQMVNSAAAYAFPVAAFLAFTVGRGEKLTVDVAFPALSLFQSLQASLREVPELITAWVNAAVAMDRIEGFMNEPDREGADSEVRGIHVDHSGGGHVELPPPVIEISKAAFGWPGCEGAAVLKDVNVHCDVGVTLVHGKVGSGKTAFLHVLLGEMDRINPKVGDVLFPQEPVAFCAQTPWLQSMTIRDNILFHTTYDAARYRLVLDACCLLHDLAGFPAGDLSSIGENGVGLSGGQKARVALARAVYSGARVIYLDDPIAALDHDTAERITRKLFKETALMKGRLVVFVTHRFELVQKYAMQEIQVGDGTAKRLRLGEPEVKPDTTAVGSDLHEDDNEEGELRVVENEQIEDDEFKDAVPEAFIEEEYRVQGGVILSVYWRFIKAGRLSLWGTIIAAFIIFRGMNVLYFYFLKVWGDAYEVTDIDNNDLPFSWDPRNMTLPSLPNVLPLTELLHLPPPAENPIPWLQAFSVLSMALVITQSFPSLLNLALSFSAGKSIFHTAMERLSTCTFRFLDVTPAGRLMNRVTSDMSTVDGSVAQDLYACVWSGVTWISSMLVIAATAPTFLVLALFMTAVFVWIFRAFLPASQSLRRLEMVSLSPLMSNFGTLIEGLTTVRAFQAQRHFRDANIVTTDEFQRMDHFYWSLQAWIQCRFDSMSAIATFTLTVAAVLGDHGPGTVAFILTTAAGFVAMTHVLCRQYGDLQMKFLSVERVMELVDLETEDPGLYEAPENWPGPADDVVFENVTVRYAPHLDPALRNVSLKIPAGKTVAITGRTGSGKSTLALSLLGIVMPETSMPLTPYTDNESETTREEMPSMPGFIWIGGVDISRIDKNVLRGRISFVAQEPVLFPGSLRDNLDPLHQYSDEVCTEVLKTVMRGTTSNGSEFTLDTNIDSGGKNLSQGQRQLVGIGRAVLRRSQVVILDEATASVDVETAREVMKVLREGLRGSTVITIAHRAEAVRDADWEVVLEKGRVVYSSEVRQVDVGRE